MTASPTDYRASITISDAVHGSWLCITCSCSTTTTRRQPNPGRVGTGPFRLLRRTRRNGCPVRRRLGRCVTKDVVLDFWARMLSPNMSTGQLRRPPSDLGSIVKGGRKRGFRREEEGRWTAFGVPSFRKGIILSAWHLWFYLAGRIRINPAFVPFGYGNLPTSLIAGSCAASASPAPCAPSAWCGSSVTSEL